MTGRRHPTRRFPGKLGARPDRFEERKLDALAREAARGRHQQRMRKGFEPRPEDVTP